ncbi:DUF2867 domain-containing protein [Dysgonomonas massiliensis]|uniref:DUF2867 domain-containing protein n=1 Tax=Dysgonomonas massiliensis TaxID=2040292 RepID=UPI000C78A6C4|nr:DUF2867 domain-containing protein [Dysgonomonas massiliensis]
MKSYKTDIPASSLTQKYFPVDYSDAFACEVMEDKKLSMEEIMISFWTVGTPAWVNTLFKLRNILVRPFGLETGESEDRSQKIKEIIQAGSGNNGLMSVTDKSDNEIVVLLSDKHLDAYMSIFIDKKEELQTVTAITLVHYHNRIGKIYFFFVRPFHKVVVKSMLKRTLKTNSK